MGNLIIPNNYQPLLNLRQTELAIKQIKDFFQTNLSSELHLRRVTAPLFVLKGMGINDDLTNGDRAVTFPIKDLNEKPAEIVHSLAKWKRLTLADLQIEEGYGIYTDMNAIRADEEMDNTHSIYVDQWDWERVISEKERNIEFLQEIVTSIFNSIKRTEYMTYEMYPSLKPQLPKTIKFIHSEELLQLYPNLSPKERENKITEKYGAVFIIGIGNELSNNEPHDLRSPDYDDWTSDSSSGYKGLNGDIILWNNTFKQAFEISSMGIRVNKEAMLRQLEMTSQNHRKQLYFHTRLLNDELPLTIGGGIGQSRLCMFLLQKAHIGEVQSSIWPEEMRTTCKKAGINLII